VERKRAVWREKGQCGEKKGSVERKSEKASVTWNLEKELFQLPLRKFLWRGRERGRERKGELKNEKRGTCLYT